jgi:toxin ParE1/3/4
LPKFSVSKAAQADLRSITRYTFEKWGAAQAAKYSLAQRNCFQKLANSPGMGRECASISSGLRRHEQGKHVVFYRLKPGGIRIVRVLHQQMIPARSHFEL